MGYNNPAMQTPNIDRLARTGVRFGHHYATPTCTPTRVGLMTGRYPSRYGVTSPAYGDIFGEGAVTLPGALRQAGYTTHISGKWHMGSPPECTPLKYGFDTSYGYFHGQIDPYTHLYKTGVRSWHRNDEYLEEKGHATDLIADEAVRIIENAGEKPFFLYTAFSVPHFPLDEPWSWLDRFPETETTSRRQYNASVSHMDEAIGRIVEALERTGRRENTLIVFVSDNGGQRSWSSAEQYRGRYKDKPHTVLGDNEPLRGWKGDVYEGGIRVPALANFPGVPESSVVEQPVHIVDWMPTLCGLAGSDPGSGLRWDGIDVWPHIAGTAGSTIEREMYWKTPGMLAARHGDWKLIQNHAGGNAQLFNLADDPLETRNLIQELPAKAKDLKDRLERIRKDDRER